VTVYNFDILEQLHGHTEPGQK